MKRSATALACLLACASPAAASLVTFQVYTGGVDVSTDGAVSTGNVATISAGIPSGASITAAYMYTATQWFAGGTDFSLSPPPGVQLNGNELTYDATFFNAGIAAARPEIRLSSHRADVTNIVAAAYDGLGGTYDFDYAETEFAGDIDGSALVVVFDDPTLSDRTVAILNGASSSTGDTATATFEDPLDPSAPGFDAELFLGINFSTGDSGQVSEIRLNGQLLSGNAGGFDDGIRSDGQLLTVGSFDDPISPPLPSSADDTERYDLTPFLSLGDTSLQINSFNGTNDDNIFLAVLDLTGTATITTPDDPGGPVIPPIPLPATGLLLLGALGLLGARQRLKSS